MNDAQKFANALNQLVKDPQFSYVKARAAARKEPRVNALATKARNAEFNPDVDGCESFVMLDGSLCEWMPGQFRYAGKASNGG